MSVIFKVTKITDERNGYGMPIIEISSNQEINIYNKGQNVFKAEEEIDHSDLKQLKDKVITEPGKNTAHLRITTPTRSTCAWYCLVSNIITW
jgi:hypothetical protein